MRYAVVLVGLASGCDVVLSLSHLPGGGIDAAAIDAAPDAPDCVLFDQYVTADVALFAASTSEHGNSHGAEAILNIGTVVKAEALQRFNAPVLAPDQHIAALQLFEPFVANATACAANCGSCGPIAHAGTFSVAFATSAWDETVACFDKPSGTTSWQTIGATGPKDRGPIVGMGDSVARTELQLVLDANKIDDWVQGTQLSIIVTPSNSGVTIVPQKDYSATVPICTPVPPQVRLRFTACR